jgi:hypothetical protein
MSYSKIGLRGYYPTLKDHPFPTKLLEKLSKLTTYEIIPPYEEKQKIIRR